MVTRSGVAGNRSNSCLTSQQAEYQAWKVRKDSTTKKIPSSVGSSCNSSTSSSSTPRSVKQNSKIQLRQCDPGAGNMKRSNSFHHDAMMSDGPREAREDEFYHVDEDEFFLPIYSTEGERQERLGAHRRGADQLSALDSLGRH